MARLQFPDAASIDRVQATAGTSLLSAAGAEARVYLDAAGLQLADILNEDGSANASSTLILDNQSRLPLFQGPTSGVDVLYVRVDGGSPLKVDATIAARLGAQNSAVAQTVAAQLTAQDEALDETLTTVVADLAGNTHRLLSKLTRGTEDAAIFLAGDSTGNETTEWLYLTAVDLAARFPAYTVNYYLWDSVENVYSSATVLQVGTGTKVLSVWNGSVAGKQTGYHLAPYLETMVASKQPDLIFVSHGHNEGTSAGGMTPDQWRAMYLALTETLSEAVPAAGLVLIGQNPETTNEDQATRAGVYADVAAMRGYGFLDVHAAFKAVSTWATTLMADTVHPNAAGSRVWADVVLAALVYRAGAFTSRTQPPSSLTVAGEQLVANGSFAEFTGSIPDDWTLLGTATATKDLVNYRSANGYAVAITSTTAASGIRQSLPLNKVLGRWVTITALVRVPSGALPTAGRIALTDASGTITSRSTTEGQGDFRRVVLTKRIDPSSSVVRVTLYGDSAGGGGSAVFDEVFVSFGLLPRGAAAAGAQGPTGPAGPADESALGYLGTLGHHPAMAYAGSTSTTINTANTAHAVPFRPQENITVAFLDWLVGSASSGNYDVGIYDDAGTRLWAKGSTAWPTASTTITETVSPTVLLTAGTRYWLLFSADNTTGTFRGFAQSSSGQGKLVDGSAFGRVVSTAFPLPSSVTIPATAAGRIPNVTFRAA